jgi:murein DD-endopeptidase
MTGRPLPRSSRLLLALAVSALVGCSSAPRHPEPDVAANAARQALAMQGRPYRYGGSTPQQGFDCSGLVQYSYRRVGVPLPRSTEQLWRSSRAISPHQLRPGDLVFFDQEGKRYSHVGVYLGNDQFVHAPSSGKHVSVAKLSDSFWRRHFNGGRRVIVD